MDTFNSSQKDFKDLIDSICEYRQATKVQTHYTKLGPEDKVYECSPGMQHAVETFLSGDITLEDFSTLRQQTSGKTGTTKGHNRWRRDTSIKQPDVSLYAFKTFYNLKNGEKSGDPRVAVCRTFVDWLDESVPNGAQGAIRNKRLQETLYSYEGANILDLYYDTDGKGNFLTFNVRMKDETLEVRKSARYGETWAVLYRCPGTNCITVDASKLPTDIRKTVLDFEDRHKQRQYEQYLATMPPEVPTGQDTKEEGIEAPSSSMGFGEESG